VTISLTFTRTFATQCGLDGDEDEIRVRICLSRRNTKPTISSRSEDERGAQIRLTLSKNAAAKGVEQKNSRNIAKQKKKEKKNSRGQLMSDWKLSEQKDHKR